MQSSLVPIIGLEVHFELKTESKMFCSCSPNHFQKPANIQVCPICLGLPGTLPVPNQKAIQYTLMIALVFKSKIDRQFMFDRKNYFYPDLPKGYQISQHFSTIGRGGEVEILENGQFIKIPLQDIHLEEDTAKLIHKKEYSLIDFNRSGVPLVEIVSQPKIHTPSQAKAYLKRIQQTVRWLGISDCDMEKGSMRLEANISLSKDPDKLPPYKIEIKNLNSFRFVEKALEYEIARQKKIILSGQIPKQETRGFSPEKGITYPQRIKEEAKDYRYFPDPDIPPFSFDYRKLQKIKKFIPHLPWDEEKKLIDKFKINWKDAQIIASKKVLLDFFYKLSNIAEKKKINITKLATMLVNKKIDWKKEDPKRIVEQMIKDEKEKIRGGNLLKLVEKVIKENSKAIADYKKGKLQVISFLIGQVQKLAQGKADINQTKNLLKKKLAI